MLQEGGDTCGRAIMSVGLFPCLYTWKVRPTPSPPSLCLTFSDIFFRASKLETPDSLSSTRLHFCCLTAAVQNANAFSCSVPVQRKF